MAGTCALLCLALRQVHSVSWLGFTAFVGAIRFQSALTRWCLMEEVLRTRGVREGHAGRREDSGCPPTDSHDPPLPVRESPRLTGDGGLKPLVPDPVPITFHRLPAGEVIHCSVRGPSPRHAK